MSSDLERLAGFAARDPVYQNLVAKHLQKRSYTIRFISNRSSPEYKIWRSMIQRCVREPDQNYQGYRIRYAARGVTVCMSWRKDYRNFLRDMGPRPSMEHFLTRRAMAPLYCKENCFWGTRSEVKQQMRIANK